MESEEMLSWLSLFAIPLSIFALFLVFTIPQYSFNEIDFEVNDTNVSINGIYGELTGKPVGVVSITTPNTYVNVTNITEGLSNGFTNGNGKLTALHDGVYKIASSWSFSGGAINEYHTRLAVNNVGVNHCHSARKIGTGGDIGSASFTCIERIYAGDILTLQIEDVTSGKDVNIASLNLNLVRIGN